MNNWFFLVKSLISSDSVARLGMNFPQYVIYPRNLLTSDAFAGGLASSLAFTFFRVGLIPLSDKTCPMNSRF